MTFASLNLRDDVTTLYGRAISQRDMRILRNIDKSTIHNRENKWTCIMLELSTSNNIENIRFLVSEEFDTETGRLDGHNCLSVAVLKQNYEAIKIFLACGVKIEPLPHSSLLYLTWWMQDSSLCPLLFAGGAKCRESEKMEGVGCSISTIGNRRAFPSVDSPDVVEQRRLIEVERIRLVSRKCVRMLSMLGVFHMSPLQLISILDCAIRPFSLLPHHIKWRLVGSI